MMKVAKLCTVTGVLICLLALALPGQADTFIKQVDNIDAIEMMGQKQPAKSDTSTAWYGSDKACMIAADGMVTIYRPDKGAMYMVDHNNKTFAEVPLTWLQDAKDKAEDAGVSEQMKMMSAMMKFKVTVTPTEETMKIKDWDASKYILDIDMGMGKVKADLWAAPDLEIDYSAYATMGNAMMAQFDGFEESLEEMKKIEGMPVLTNTEVMMMGTAMKSSTELIEFSNKDAPDGIYEIPEGYEKTDMPNPMGR
jgi:hypothetical protein